jgi:hypothetical protein
MLPAIALSIPVGGMVAMKSDINTYPQIVLAQQDMDAMGLPIFDKQAVEDRAHMLDARAKAIDAYFAARNMPLKGTGMKFALEADKHDLDWRLLPAIAVIETTGGQKACPLTYKKTGDIRYTYNAFGWGSCKISFESQDEAIEVIARNLSGDNPNTAKHYDGKTTVQILEKYNPPSVKPGYATHVIGVMNAIGEDPLAK